MWAGFLPLRDRHLRGAHGGNDNPCTMSRGVLKASLRARCPKAPMVLAHSLTLLQTWNTVPTLRTVKTEALGAEARARFHRAGLGLRPEAFCLLLYWAFQPMNREQSGPFSPALSPPPFYKGRSREEESNEMPGSTRPRVLAPAMGGTVSPNRSNSPPAVLANRELSGEGKVGPKASDTSL